MTFEPDRYYLRRGCTEQITPEFFVDVDGGITWQPGIYPEALAQTHERMVIIDLGCGRADKLIASAYSARPPRPAW